MEVRERKIGSVVVLSLEGRLDQMAAPKLNAPITAGSTYLVLDMNGVDYIASSGISALLNLVNRAREKGGNVVLARLQVQIAAVIESMRLDKVFDAYDDVKSAAAAVLKGPAKPPEDRSGD